jgi:hypothetical protein
METVLSTAATPASPWDVRLTWPELLAGRRVLSLDAPPAALARIADDLDLEGLEGLCARLTLEPWLDGVRIDGRIEALAIRLCGISLEPFEEPISEAIRLRIVPAGSPNAPQPEGEALVIDLEAEDPPDEAGADGVDVTAYVVEALGLALDPFPRKPGAVFEPPQPSGALTPFAVLASLARRDGAE